MQYSIALFFQNYRIGKNLQLYPVHISLNSVTQRIGDMGTTMKSM